jgi:probable F420-dependent oxidoreductase
MDYGLALPNYRAGSSVEGIEAAAEAAERLGYTSVWSTDHLAIDRANADEYGRIFEAILTLAHVGALTTRVRIGASVVVVPMRPAVVVAKELVTLDVLSRGRLIAGVGVGWNATEFANVGAADRFHVRGAYTDEAIRLWRHLWSGSPEPFRGRFNDLTDYVFEPLPTQPGGPPIVVGGGSEAACRRAGTLGDGYHFSAAAPASVGRRVALVREAARVAGRPTPPISGRARLEFDITSDSGYAMRGSPDAVAAEVRAFRDVGVSHLVVAIGPTDAEGYVAVAERFASEVIPLVERDKTGTQAPAVATFARGDR